MNRVEILIGAQTLENWTRFTLRRAKKNMTGELSVDIFLDYVPPAPISDFAMQGEPIAVYIGGQCVFTGALDKRRARGLSHHGKQGVMKRRQTEIHATTDASGYRITLLARGKTKYLIDSSHIVKTGTIRKTTDKKAIEQIAAPHGIKIDWQAEETPIERLVLRDGALCADEIFRICNELCHFVYETADGVLRIADSPAPAAQMPRIALGYNVMEFSAEQSEDRANSEILVKGHRSRRGIWGQDAILDTQILIKDKWIGSFSPLVVQHYGDATPEALQRRAKWEADKRAVESKQATCTVFDVLDETGAPWDIGRIYQVSIPSEGIDDQMECVELTYEADAQGRIDTRLTLAPPPAPKTAGNADKLLGKKSAGAGAAKKTSGGKNSAGYPNAWNGAELMELPPQALENAFGAGYLDNSGNTNSLLKPKQGIK